MRPGPKNLITDVPGVRIGNAHSARMRSGVTVVLPDASARGAADIRGGGPGTRETETMADWGTAQAMVGTKEGSLADDHWAMKGTIALTGVFLACFAVYYFANWKALADVWPVR